MASWMTRTLLGMTLALGATALQAQESSNVVATMTDWSVFVEESPKECWGVSSPKETVNTKDGNPVQVRRGDILLFVTFRPSASGEISLAEGCGGSGCPAGMMALRIGRGVTTAVDVAAGATAGRSGAGAGRSGAGRGASATTAGLGAAGSARGGAAVGVHRSASGS